MTFLENQNYIEPCDITQIYHAADIEPIESNTFEKNGMVMLILLFWRLDTGIIFIII